MKIIALNRSPYFSRVVHLQQLNGYFALHSGRYFMPHEIAAATGCTLDDAMGILLLLWNLSLAEASTLIYHNSHSDGPPIQSRKLNEGIPDFPIICDVCGEQIEQADDLLYDFLFQVSEDIEFTT